MKILFLGPPGAGKGTQARKITEEFGWPQISTGDILRSAVADETDLGKKAKSYMNKGELVPDDLIIDLIRERLGQPDCQTGFLLDGFPRTVPQAEALDELLEQLDWSLDRVLLLKVPDEILIKRITGRRVCKACGATFHVKLHPPKKEGVCDECGSDALYQRKDDNEKTVRNRLNVYQDQTAPLIEYYEKKDLVMPLNGDQHVDELFGEIKKAIS